MKKQKKKGGIKTESRSWLAFLQGDVQRGVFFVLLVAGIALFSVLTTVDHLAKPELTQEVLQQEEVWRHPLTGEVLDAPISAPNVFAVMIENAADAWPLVGLNDAFLVIEAPVEGGIPRFIAFFSEENETIRIGPVRSARPYYVQWAQGLQAMYAHVGGSPEALDLIASTEMFYDLNQFWFGKYFYRDEISRFAPHNVYTTMNKLRLAFTEEFGDRARENDFVSWQFKQDAPRDNSQTVSIDFAQADIYDVQWRYDQSQNNYLRLQGEYPMKMEDGAMIYADNVIVLATDIRSIDAVDRKRIVTIGEGDAMIIQDGGSFLARWEKQSSDDRLQFYVEGEPVLFNAGVTWIEVVSSLSQVQM